MGGGTSKFQTWSEAMPCDARQMAGKWYVIQSNLEFWDPTKNNRLCPVVRYDWMEPTDKEQEEAKKQGKPLRCKLKDITEYYTGKNIEKKGDLKQLFGVDHQDEQNDSVWKWKGSGMLCLLTSDWQFVAHDPEYKEWAITVFGKTTFTKDGFDIYSRKPYLSEETLASIHTYIESHPFLKERAQGLFKTIQDPAGTPSKPNINADFN